jgi:uncharacterized membrane protein (DUF4010 family)
VLVIAGAAVAVLWQGHQMRTGKDITDHQSGELSLPTLESPFSLTAALKFGIIFLALGIAGTFAQRALGEVGFYAVGAVGGVISRHTDLGCAPL